MCLGIPGRIVEFDEGNEHLAVADVVGVRRRVNIGLVIEDGLVLGDHVLIHVGFAMSIIDEDEAKRALEGLQLMGREYEEEIRAITDSRIT